MPRRPRDFGNVLKGSPPATAGPNDESARRDSIPDMRTVSATYQNGVARPDFPLPLPERCRVTVVIPDQAGFPVAPDGIGDLSPFVGTMDIGARNAVEKQRKTRDAEWR